MGINEMNEFIQRKKGSKKGFTILRLLSYFRFHPWLTAASLSLAVIVNISAIAKPYILKIVIDNGLAKGMFDQRQLLFFGALYLSTVLLGSGGGYTQAITLARLGQLIMHRLRTSLFSHIQKLNMSFFDKNSSGKILTRVNSDIEALSDLFSGTLLLIARDVLLMAGIISAMFSMDARLALWCMCSLPVVVAIIVLSRIFTHKNFMRVKALISKINSFLAENIIGMKIVQIFAKEDKKYDEFRKLGREYYKLGLREVLLNSFSNPLLIAVANVLTALLLWFFAGDVKSGVLQIGVLFAFTTYIKQLFDPIAEIADQFTSVQSALISADRVFDLMDEERHLEDFDKGIRTGGLRGEIEFRNVWFAYEGEDYVLKDISLKIEPGRRCAFVGATGSGKSTIIALLARFYDIRKGQILLDGIDIKEYNLADLRRRIAIVMQDVFLFSGDVSYNIRLNNEDITDEDIDEAIKNVSADKFIDKLENGVNQTVSERGGSFSAGQRQLVAFARAVAFKPSVLVLDEATANIDTETEIAIVKAVEEVSADRTVIIIAHRIATIVSSDIIFVMHQGRLAECGSHAELYSRNGLYTRLYDKSCNAAYDLTNSI